MPGCSRHILRIVSDMKKTNNIYALCKLAVLLCFALPLFHGCVEELSENPGHSGLVQEGEGWLTIDFGASCMPVITTRATAESENRLFNFYLFIFNNSDGEHKGKKVYGRMFDEKMMVSETAFATAGDEECWFVKYPYDTYPAGGSVRVKAPLGSNYNIYMIGNLDADMIRISSELLNHAIDSEADLNEFVISMNQEVVSRNGYFPMSGSLRNVAIKEAGDGTAVFEPHDSGSSTMSLRRFDAKIEFEFKAGNKEVAGQKIKSFEAKQWRVINVPKTSYVLSYSERLGDDSEEITGKDSGNVPPETLLSSYSGHAADFFDTDFRNVDEITSNDEYRFTFYMLPNRMTPKKNGFTGWNERDRQVKLPNGVNQMTDVSYSTSDGAMVSKQMRVFENANDFSTYVLVTGRVEMDLTNDSAGQTLGADVQYLIHLGDWSEKGAADNYNVRRNKHYKYKVTVNSVHNIRVEVESGNIGENVIENQPGAIGEVVIAKEEIAICDAHYTTKVLTFHLGNFYNGNKNIADELTWKVKTPFGEGEPEIIGGYDVPTCPDYKWVHFRLNKKNTGADGKKSYDLRSRKYIGREFAVSETLRTADDNKEGDGTPGAAGYHNDGCMDIIALVKYIKEQVRRYETYKEYGGENTSDFDDSDDPKICVTVFVDEYYYEEDPWTGEKSTYLWKKFVNAPDRSMNILCDTYVSKDGESRETGSVITIQQHSMRSIFNTDESITGLKTAWGLEMTDEYPNMWQWKDRALTGNSDPANGLLNSACLWGLYDKSAGDSFKTGAEWSTFIDWETPNGTPLLKDKYRDLRYSCLARNRDNNGDGQIGRDEIRWYTASIRQLVGMYIADGILPQSSRLYNRSAKEMESMDLVEENGEKVYKWMQHVISSTQYNGTGPVMVWAEEGISTGDYDGTNQENSGSYQTIRCVRNLGLLDETKEPEEYGLDKTPQSFGEYVKATESASGNAYFDAAYINPAALRYYTSRELDLHHNNSEENRIYRKFEISSETVSITVDFGDKKFGGINDLISSEIQAGRNNPFCPEGYRLPNQRELSVLLYYSDLSFTLGNMTPSRTYWIFGDMGPSNLTKKKLYSPNANDPVVKNGFNINSNGNITVGNGEALGTARCVRDVRD